MKKTLALGKFDSAFYKSLSDALFVFGDVVYKSEHDFSKVMQLIEYIKKNNIDQVLMPNPYGNNKRKVCYEKLKEFSIPVIASDRGALPGSWFFDSGFNADSESFKINQWDIPLEKKEREDIVAYIEDLRSSRNALEKQGDMIGGVALKQRLGLNNKKIVFVPLQRPKDTVIKFFSDTAKSVENFVRVIDAVAKKMGDDWVFILKKHPLEVDYYLPESKNVHYVYDSAHVNDLIEMSDAVALINSGVGVLALAHMKPVLNMGAAFYSHHGLAKKIDSVDDIYSALSQLESPDEEKVYRFFHHLVERVYSFCDFDVERIKESDGSFRTITRKMRFSHLRILQETVPVNNESILIVSSVVPYPIYRGSQSRIDTVIRSLISQGKKVHLCILNTSFGKEKSRKIRDNLFERYPQALTIEVRRDPKFHSGFGRLKYQFERLKVELTGGKHLVSNSVSCPYNFKRAVSDMCESIKPDYILVNYAKLAPVVPNCFKGIKVIDTHDYQTSFLREDQIHNNENLHINLDKYEKSEKEWLRKFDKIIAINPNEKKIFENIAPSSKTFCAPAFEEKRYIKKFHIGHQYDAMFVGSVSNFNVSGLNWFIANVLPEIVKVKPFFKLAVAGNIKNSQKVLGKENDNIKFLGVVPDLSKLYSDSRVVLAPILAGAGMKIKVIEALSHSKAIVGTSVAFDGINAVNGKHAFITDDYKVFAKNTIELLESSSTKEHLEFNAGRLHANEHSPETIGKVLAKVFA